jgi:hypothetical protein
MLLLQAMGLGGWLYHGIDRHAVLGATGDPNVPVLGFRYDTDDRWSIRRGYEEFLKHIVLHITKI